VKPKTLLIAIVLIIGAIGGTYSIIRLNKTLHSSTPWPTKEWLTSSPEEQGMNSTKLKEMIEYIDEQGYTIDSILVIRNGYLVFEEYRSFYTKTTSHETRSATKSFTSAIIGIAIKEGYIENINQKVIDFFPEQNIQNLDSRKKSITIEHLLTMSTGLDWTHSLYGTTGEMYSSSDWVQFVLNRPHISFQPSYLKLQEEAPTSSQQSFCSIP
jgi:CubicO group peptidase (beta-lactamase class C family)